MSRTSIVVADGHTRLRHGLLRAQAAPSRGGWVRLGLLSTTALLLGGDVVELEITVGEGVRVDLYDVAGTVAYHGRGRSSAWHTRVSVAAGGCLVWSGEPLVVADGAEVTRTLEVEAAVGATVLLRETLVLGRSGELGGRLDNQTTVSRAGELVLREDQLLDPDGVRRLPGLLGEHRIIDSVLGIGAGPADELAAVLSYDLVDDVGWVRRHLGAELADSPVGAGWAALRRRWTAPADQQPAPAV